MTQQNTVPYESAVKKVAEIVIENGEVLSENPWVKTEIMLADALAHIYGRDPEHVLKDICRGCLREIGEVA